MILTLIKGENGKKYIDVNYESIQGQQESEDLQNIEGVYFNAVQVAKMLNESDSTIRYWAKEFGDLLNIKMVNGIKKYTKTDIDNLKYIKKLLKEDNFTINQAYEYCCKKGFDSDTGLIDANNHLAIKSFISAMTMEMEDKIKSMQANIIQENKEFILKMMEFQKTMNEETMKSLALTVDEVVSDKLNEAIGEIKLTLDAQEQQAKTRDNQLIDKLKKSLDDHRLQQEYKQQLQQKKSLFSRLFSSK